MKIRKILKITDGQRFFGRRITVRATNEILDEIKYVAKKSGVAEQDLILFALSDYYHKIGVWMKDK